MQVADQKNQETIKKNIEDAIRKAKTRGTTGMSLGNLFQMTSTRGVTCPIPLYRPTFKHVVGDVAKAMKFKLYW